MTCKKTQEFLAKTGVTARAEQNAKKETIAAAEAVAIAKKASEIYATKGKKVLHLNLKKDQPSDEEIAALVVGPSGNLRAPTLRLGKLLLVGFDEETYAKFLFR